MEIRYWVILFFFIIWAGVLSARLWCYRKQINDIRRQLEFLKNEDTNYRLTSYASIGKAGEIIDAVNAFAVRMREEERRLKKENRIYRESITSISHDIRTPLTSAKGYIQMLQKGELTEEKRKEYLEIAEGRLDDVADMLGQLFEYARIEAGEMEWEPEEFYAGKVFARTISLFYEEFCEKGCEPEVIIAKEPCKIRADRHCFIRIIENLVKNALVHGTGEYRMELAAEGGRMVLRVGNLTDSIEPWDMDKIFDRFYTTDQSRSRKCTGLGLAIVKRFTEQMGGETKAYLKGKRFTIEVWLPLAAPENNLPDRDGSRSPVQGADPI